MEKKDSLQRKSEAVIAKIDCVLRKEPQKLAAINKGKEGRPFLYSDDLIMAISFFRFYFCPKLRQTEALVRRMYGDSPDHTTIDRRLSTIKPKWAVINRKRSGRLLAIDASGISVSDRGGYRDAKYGSKPKFYKLHAMIDVEDMELVDFRLTSEHVADNRKFLPIARESLARGDTLYADGAYDAKDNFDYLGKNGIKAGIKIRKNFSINYRGSSARWKAVIEQFGIKTRRLKGRMHFLPADGIVLDEDRIRYHQDKWKKKVGYGRRWLVEAFFSVFKRVYGNYASSRSWRKVKNEMTLKLLLYNALLKI